MTALTYYASFSHFFMKLFLAAPFNGLPLLSTAFGSQASFLHFWTKLFFAAPVSGFPAALTALLSHVSWASAEPMPSIMIAATMRTRFICGLFELMNGARITIFQSI
jgi:hypothetical protein